MILEFKTWLENVVRTDEVGEAVFKTIELTLGGRWEIESNTRRLPTWKMQRYHSIRLKGKNVVRQGDYFEVYMQVYVYKRPPDVFKGMDIHSRPAWVDDETQWHPANEYDPKEGSPLIKFYVSVSGRKDINPLEEDSLHRLGDSDQLGRRINTPYEVAKFVEMLIDRFYKDWGNDGDDEVPDFDPTPMTPQFVPSSPQLIGA